MADRKIETIIKKVKARIQECKDIPNPNEEYIQGLEHCIRFIELEAKD